MLLILNRGPRPLRALLVTFVFTACVPDYSPDPIRPPLASDAGDAGGRRDAASQQDARAVLPDDPDDVEPIDERDAAEPMQESDAARPGPVDGCDLTGRWLVNERLMTNGLGARQVVSTWYLYEVTQTGSELVVDRGISCGSTVRGLPPVEAMGDMSKAYPAFLEKVSHTGRRGSSVTSDQGCRVQFDEQYIVYGASLPFYLDPAQTLPTTAEMATDSMPGWEDWEDDGHPGYTVRMTGAVTGSLYMASRTRTVYSGPIEAGARSFVLPVDWSQIKVTLGLDGSPLLDLPGVRDSDQKQHFVELARLEDDQATGDDVASCAAIRKLVPTLTPTAAQ